MTFPTYKYIFELRLKFFGTSRTGWQYYVLSKHVKRNIYLFPLFLTEQCLLTELIDIFKLKFGHELDIIINQKNLFVNRRWITGEMNINHGELTWKQQDWLSVMYINRIMKQRGILNNKIKNNLKNRSISKRNSLRTTCNNNYTNFK